jgi:hypothetical protein
LIVAIQKKMSFIFGKSDNPDIHQVIDEESYFAEFIFNTGIDKLNLGNWKFCSLYHLDYLPRLPGIYLYINWYSHLSGYDELSDTLLYVGRSKSLKQRWLPNDNGTRGHHLPYRVSFLHTWLEWSETVIDETGIIYCQLEKVHLKHLEKLELFLIQVLAPRLNRKQTPLRSFKLAESYTYQYMKSLGKPSFFDWPDSIQTFHSEIMNACNEYMDLQIRNAPVNISFHKNFDYKAVVPGFKFLPNEWQENMAYIPSQVLRKIIETKLKSLCVQ